MLTHGSLTNCDTNLKAQAFKSRVREDESAGTTDKGLIKISIGMFFA